MQSPTGGRQTKFTPANLRQITNLVERGKSREEIAEIIGVTPATLAVTCSRLKISLRRPKFDLGTRVVASAANGLSRWGEPASLEWTRSKENT
jgi:hypothetical protein